MEKTYYLTFACFENGKGFNNYQMQSAKTKKEAVKKALLNLQNAQCILIDIKRVSNSLLKLVVEHNSTIDKGESNE